MESLLTILVFLHLSELSAYMYESPNTIDNKNAYSLEGCNDCLLTKQNEQISEFKDNCEILRHLVDRDKRSQRYIFSELGIHIYIPWDSWSEWDCSCGGGRRNRFMRKWCSNRETTCTETDWCPETCQNAGTYDTVCRCTELYYGKCCENSKLM